MTRFRFFPHAWRCWSGRCSRALRKGLRRPALGLLLTIVLAAPALSVWALALPLLWLSRLLAWAGGRLIDLAEFWAPRTGGFPADGFDERGRR